LKCVLVNDGVFGFFLHCFVNWIGLAPYHYKLTQENFIWLPQIMGWFLTWLRGIQWG